MPSRQKSSRERRVAEGWRQVSVMLPPEAEAALAVLVAEYGVPQWQVIDQLLMAEMQRRGRKRGLTAAAGLQALPPRRSARPGR